MNLADLSEAVKEKMEEAEASGVSPDMVAVRLASQPGWPFQYSLDREWAYVPIDDMLSDEPLDEGDLEEARGRLMSGDEWSTRWPKGAEAVVVLAEGSQMAYLGTQFKEAIGW